MALLPVDDAIARLLAAADAWRARQPGRIERLPLAEAAGRVLAEDVHAVVAVPPADNSAMDGYALRHADLAVALAKGLPVSQRIPAGQAPQPLRPGTLARIFTGAMLPAGADTVVMQEDSEVLGERVRITVAVPLGANVRRAGEDVAAGSLVLAAATRLDAAQLGLLAAVGHGEAAVHPRLRVALLCTGDELAEPGRPLRPGQIPDSNRVVLRTLLRALDIELIDLGAVADTLDDTRAALRRARAADVALVISTGGVSVGEEDHVRAAVTAEGRLDLWKIALKPGKPLAFGALGDALFLGLPGNPQSVWVTFLVLGRPFLRRLQGEDAVLPRAIPLPAGFVRARPQGRREYLRVRLALTAEGGCHLVAHPHQGSGALSSAAWADGLALVEAGSTVAMGDLLPFLPC